MSQSLDKIYTYVIQYGLSFTGAILIIIIGKWVAGIVSRLIETAMMKTHMDKTLTIFLKEIINVGLMVFVVITALGQLGIQTTSFVAIIGAAGLAIGLALQGSLANFAAGIILILLKPFKVGDTIETSGVSGVIDEIQIFNTLLTGNDQKRIIIPNAKITSDKIIVNRS